MGILYSKAKYIYNNIKSIFCKMLTSFRTWLRHRKHAIAYKKYGLAFCKVPQLSEFTMFVHTKYDKYITQSLLNDHVWEPFETDILFKLLRKDDVFLDVGANIGWYTIIAAMAIGKEGHVHAIEPDPENFTVLSKNIHKMKSATDYNITAYNCAIGRKSAPGKLFLSASNLGDHRLFPSSDPRASMDISIKSLDDIFCKQSQRPTIVKLDTQGCEMAVLAGAEQLFANGWRPVIFFEFWPFGLRNVGDNAYSLWKFFDTLQYDTFEVNAENTRLHRLSDTSVQERLATSGMKDGEHFMDIVAIPPGYNRLVSIQKLFEA